MMMNSMSRLKSLKNTQLKNFNECKKCKYRIENKRQELSDQIEQMEQEKTAIEQQVMLQMQDAAYGTAPGYKVSWVSSESKRVDSQRLRKEQPDIFNQYSKNVSSRRFTIVHAA